MSAVRALPDFGVRPREVVILVDPDHLFYPLNPADMTALATPSGDSGSDTGNDGSLDAIAERRSLIAQRYGAVWTIAPATQVHLNTNTDALGFAPATLPLDDGLKLVLGTLTESQLKRLGAADGLPLSDLSDEQRQALFSSLPHPLPILAESPADIDPRLPKRAAEDANPVFVPEEQLLRGAVLRANLATEFFFSSPNGEEGDIFTPMRPTETKRLFEIDTRILRQTASPLRSSLRAITPNTLKRGQLAWSRDGMATPIPVAGVKTMGDLVTRIASATRLELFCDPHYAAKSVTILGGENAAVPARDLLRAVCLAQTATFRAVGPAFALTEDLEGVGARRSLLRDFTQGYGHRLMDRVQAMDSHLNALHWTDKLSFALGDPGALPAPLREHVAGMSGGMNMMMMPLGSFPSEMQARLKAALAAQVSLPPADPTVPEEFDKKQIMRSLSDKSDVEIKLGLRLSLDVPSVPYG